MAAIHPTAPAAAHSYPTANQLKALKERVERALSACYTASMALQGADANYSTLVDMELLYRGLDYAVADLKLVHGALDDLRAQLTTAHIPDAQAPDPDPEVDFPCAQRDDALPIPSSRPGLAGVYIHEAQTIIKMVGSFMTDRGTIGGDHVTFASLALSGAEDILELAFEAVDEPAGGAS